MKSMERGPALPPGAQARAERNAARRAARRQSSQPGPGRGAMSGGARFWTRTILVAVIVGFIAFSLQWSEGMPRALYVGLIVGAVTLLLILGFRLLQGRAARAR